ncbi:poly-beta-1,6-N-acetyl-D-glucosamine biosynthesis protein PgaD [Oleiagrimonas sp.]|jgi:biofilm PGA synthesis protein PgaD|uniref:poly-beta-1,6-N-acetyl-D-glucosamine biosynthesis protein PgaD n=1 Tax=Oleiagrimonas sp. TaxID=2010330 RepID=UPI00261BB2FD|nr:poly-beta-1,6-N-acetyl-D-glucosamine biosynthesis protein PgaD [Oleiagrimonas sp.]MDA3914921.1 poly-beta-1,6-N-acetyl-D-glucosamine biosynthesis protein PgaD [Oleiagrimonas sp.]
MKAETMIISNGPRLPLLNRSLYAVATLLCWLAWGYLWLPLVTLIAWMMGAHTAWIELSAEDHLKHLSDLLYICMYAGICAVIFSSWAYYNQWRFANRTRRMRPDMNVSLEEQAQTLKSTPDMARALRKQRSSVIDFGDGQVPMRLVRQADPLAAEQATEHA